MASWEEARKCPRCGVPGKEINRMPDNAGGKVIVLECQNPADQIWGPSDNQPGERYVVQVRADGTIPDPEPAPQKAFPDQGPFGSEDDFEGVRAALRAQNEQMAAPEGGETGR